MAPQGIDQIEIKAGTYCTALPITPTMDAAALAKVARVIRSWGNPSLYKGATFATRAIVGQRWTSVTYAQLCAMFEVNAPKARKVAPVKPAPIVDGVIIVDETTSPAAIKAALAIRLAELGAELGATEAPAAAAPTGIPPEGIDADAWIPDGSPVIIKGGRVYAAPVVTEAPAPKAAPAPAAAPEAPRATEAPASAPKAPKAPRAATPKAAPTPKAPKAPKAAPAPAGAEPHALAPDFSAGLDPNPIAVFTLGLEEITPARLSEIIAEREIQLVIDIRSKVTSHAFAIDKLRASLGAKYATKSQHKGGLAAILPRLKAQGIARVLFVREEEAPGDHWGTLKMGQLATAAGYPILHLFRNEDVTHAALWKAIEADLITGGDHAYDCEVEETAADGATDETRKIHDRIAKLERRAAGKGSSPSEVATCNAEIARLRASLKVAA